MSPSVSAIVPTRDEGAELRRTVHALLATMPADGEIVVVDDASEDGSTDFIDDGYPAVRVLRLDTCAGPAAARHAGAEAATGDMLVFSDAHVTPSAGWHEAFGEALRDPDVGAVGPAIGDAERADLFGFGATWRLPELHLDWLEFRSSSPHEVPLLGGAFIAMRREVYDACGGFDHGLLGWGAEDGELCARLWLLGYSCLVVPSVGALHRFQTDFRYGIDTALIVHNYLRVAFIHLDGERLERVVDHYRTHPGADRALALLACGDTYSRRAELHERRRHDDAWFFERFGISA